VATIVPESRDNDGDLDHNVPIFTTAASMRHRPFGWRTRRRDEETTDYRTT